MKGENEIQCMLVRLERRYGFFQRWKKNLLPNISINLTVGEVSFYFLSKTFSFLCKICFWVERHISPVNCLQAIEEEKNKIKAVSICSVWIGFRVRGLYKTLWTFHEQFRFCLQASYQTESKVKIRSVVQAVSNDEFEVLFHCEQIKPRVGVKRFIFSKKKMNKTFGLRCTFHN